jgi:very-short-patch-repair endonuclease
MSRNKRQKKLELNGIKIVRFLDKDIRQGQNDVLRIMEKCIEERLSKKEKTPPCPPQWGNLPRKVLKVD